MSNHVTILSAFIVTEANQLDMTIQQLIDITDEQIADAIPAEHIDSHSDVVVRKSKQAALVQYVDQKATEIADSQAFKDSITAVVPGLVITQSVIKKVIIQKVKELRA